MLNKSTDAIIFSDDFDFENGGKGKLNYEKFTKWNVTDGTVDLIGKGGRFDFYPGNGLYVDLDGTTRNSGLLETKEPFDLEPGIYKLQFDLGVNPQDTNQVTVTLGELYSETFTLSTDSPLTTVTRTINVPQSVKVKLSFQDDGNDNGGVILDNVVLRSSTDTTKCPVASETVKAPFTEGPSAVTTANTYSGKVKIDITGVGQAAETSYSDSFYRYTDNGTKIAPVSANEFGLYINGKPAQSLFPSSQDIPSYNQDHSYSFTIDAPNGALTFGVGDTFTVDNTGSYNITISELSGNCDIVPPSNGEF